MTPSEKDAFIEELLQALCEPIGTDEPSTSRLECIHVTREQWETAKRESEGIINIPKEFEDGV